MYLGLLKSALLYDLLDDILVDVGAEFIVESRMGGAVHCTLGSVPVTEDVSMK